MKENAVLRAIRAMLKMKQEEFASLIGIGRSEYAIIETENLIVNNRIRSRAEAASPGRIPDPGGDCGAAHRTRDGCRN